MLIGYARVSTPDQKLDLQRDELKRAGCRKLFTDVIGGAKTDRPGRAEALAFARKGDTIVVWKLDRFGRSLVDLVHTVHELRERHVGFRSLHESIDTTTSGGRLIFHVFSALAEFERDLIRERTMAGLSAARARGRKGGRPPVLDEKQRALLHSLAKDRTNSPAVICATLGISRSSFYRYLGEGPAKPTPAIAASVASATATSAASGSSPATRGRGARAAQARPGERRRAARGPRPGQPRAPAARGRRGSDARRLPASERRITVKGSKSRR